MKRILALLFTGIFSLALLAGCSGGSSSNTASKTPATTQDYVDAITSSRSDEENEAYNIITNETGDDDQMLLSFFGVAKEDMTNYAISMSMINIKSYGIAIVMPGEGKAQTILDAANAFVEMQQNAQENYLPDQYAIAKAAIVKQLDSGEVVLVMCEDSSTVLSNIEKALNA